MKLHFNKPIVVVKDTDSINYPYLCKNETDIAFIFNKINIIIN